MRGFGQQFAVAPVVTLALGSLAPQRLKLASGLFNLMRGDTVHGASAALQQLWSLTFREAQTQAFADAH